MLGKYACLAFLFLVWGNRAFAEDNTTVLLKELEALKQSQQQLLQTVQAQQQRITDLEKGVRVQRQMEKHLEGMPIS